MHILNWTDLDVSDADGAGRHTKKCSKETDYIFAARELEEGKTHVSGSG